MVSSIWPVNQPPLLTGKFRFRVGLRQRLVLEVEERLLCTNTNHAPRPDGMHLFNGYRWRDGVAGDLQNAVLRRSLYGKSEADQIDELLAQAEAK